MGIRQMADLSPPPGSPGEPGLKLNVSSNVQLEGN